MSPLRILCPECDAAVRVRPEAAARGRVRCPACGADFALTLPTTLPEADTGGEGRWLAWSLLGVGALFAGTMAALLVMLTTQKDGDPPAAVPAPVEVAKIIPAPIEAAPVVAPAAPIAAANPPAASPPAANPPDPNGPAAFPPPAREPAVVLPALDDPVAVRPPAAGPIERPRLRYRWEPGREYVYNLTIEAQGGARPTRITGTLRYQVKPDAPQTAAVEEQTGSGTGFIVQRDGYLVTCAHVVQDAVSIRVSLGERVLPAQVVAFDRRRDLALIKVAARNLPTVPLADSDAVELAQDVRAVGFPLSDILGSNVKITQGSISGVNTRDGHRLFQIDASIEPGNSGGPVVNDRGEVIGVASQKLTGVEISNVGFVVTSNDVKRMLTNKGIAFQTAGAQARLEGPELARRVTPAIALIRVTTGSGGVGSAQQAALEFHGSYTEGALTQAVAGATVVVSEFGEIREISDKRPLPHLLGPMAAFLLTPLSPSGADSWQEHSRVAISRETDSSPFPRGFGPPIPRPPFGPRFGPRFGPFGMDADEPDVKEHLATENVSYTARSLTQTAVEITKRYELKSDESINGRPLVHLTAAGTIEFDVAQGVPVRSQCEATLNRNDDGRLQQTPLKIRIELVQ